MMKMRMKEGIGGGKVKKGDVVKGVVVGRKKGVGGGEGCVIGLDGNGCVVVKKKREEGMGRGIFGGVSGEVGSEKLMKIMSVGREVV